MVIVPPASAVPASVGVFSLVALPLASGPVPGAVSSVTLPMAAGNGAALSMTALAGSLTLPAASMVVTVTAVPSGRAGDGV